MRKGIYLIASLMLAACSEVNDIDTVKETGDMIVETADSTQQENVGLKHDSVSIEELEASTEFATYNAEWFRIDYPKDFTPSPTFPIATDGDYKYIETNEATFTSPDGNMEFFIYSPQWNGAPKDYLIKKENEKIVDVKEESADYSLDSDDPLAASHHWMTFEDKDGKYIRSYHSIKSELTHHVFGIKYTHPTMYTRYRKAYVRFKESLQQFAD